MKLQCRAAVVLNVSLFFSSAIELLFQLFPGSVLGVILFVAGLQLALGSSVLPADRSDRIVVLAGAALCMWNVGVGFVVGIALHGLLRRGWLRL